MPGWTRPQISGIVATGYGRNAIRFADTTITEITCHARGVHHLAPDARTVIEIGGQDSKVIALEDGGRVRDFAMNDRCAAGTGRFLEMVATRLDLDWDKLSALAQQSQKPALISNMCVVFAETEIIGLLADGKPLPDVVAGVQNAIATRVSALAGRFISPPVYFTGGVALQPGMGRALEEVLSCPVRVAPQPQFTGALGAAVLAGERKKNVCKQLPSPANRRQHHSEDEPEDQQTTDRRACHGGNPVRIPDPSNNADDQRNRRGQDYRQPAKG